MPFSTQAKILLLIILMAFPCHLRAQDHDAIPRFFLMGDGQIQIAGQKVIFRSPEGHYLETGLKKLNTLLNNQQKDPLLQMNLRFLEVLDYLQDQLKGGNYQVRSGYRSPQYNQSLRKQGKMAAQSSMHIEGAAADLILTGVPSQKVFDYVKSLDCCGIGFYHSAHFHLDTGPSRYWDEKTSKTESKKPQQNSKVILQTQFDYYQRGEEVYLSLMRVTEFPIGIKKEAKILMEKSEKNWTENLFSENSCQILHSQIEARHLKLKLPQKIKKGTAQIQVEFCGDFDYPEMPKVLNSRTFEIK
ncbi:MAG: DUF882 domain-containing protein [Deltaproteobacteria bacterium]|nr:DUF882 domain-containing protein [Deltaproteobacteria bacterium]